MVEAIGKAHAVPFQAALGYPPGRLISDSTGAKWWTAATMWRRNADKLPSHPLDPDGERAASQRCRRNDECRLVNFVRSASVLGPDSYLYSADYPGAMERYVESQKSGVRRLFVDGGAGDINPYRDKGPIVGQGLDAVEEMTGVARTTELMRQLILLASAAAVSEPGSLEG
jgi:hypothetical protein